jgi:hypothetical protein
MTGLASASPDIGWKESASLAWPAARSAARSAIKRSNGASVARGDAGMHRERRATPAASTSAPCPKKVDRGHAATTTGGLRWTLGRAALLHWPSRLLASSPPRLQSVSLRGAAVGTFSAACQAAFLTSARVTTVLAAR